MTKFNFSLKSGDTGPLIKASSPDILHIPMDGMTPIMAAGDQVLGGTKVAIANANDEGDMHSPLAGIIREIQPYAMLVEVRGNDRIKPHEPCSDSGDTLRSWLKDKGVCTRHLVKAATFIINAVPPEPGISIYDPLLRDYRKTLELGLGTVQKIVEPNKMFLVAAKGNRANAFANCTVMHVAPVYPNGLDPLIIKTVTGQEVLPGMLPDNGTILSVKDLYFIGRVMETGRPLTETVMTINGDNHLVAVGTPVGFLAAKADTIIHPGDRVVIGGPLRGLAAVNLEQGVDKDASGLHILRQSEGMKTTDNFCLGCGECERHCPARIMPGLISRCAEFKQFKRAETYHIHSCMECGLCGYWCTAGRPLLQYIRLAKYELALLAGAVQPPRPTPEDIQKGQSGDEPC
ncbi:electron transport complex protein RnfC [Pseudodesulfovibrio nedwellii]|uniref:Electron transport complex protein RnfC n=1 Tax=Pseudodesulfovibrio nedwellii TaxID=2973072 RepID=A0ABN6RZS6_9BACT|nr:electron transporter RnfC [Pseudodesulfovibrio nedwellii]BDQ36495.1 electron transport complex protein RnfC [Pseudodesulfovibrio nedwellii]